MLNVLRLSASAAIWIMKVILKQHESVLSFFAQQSCRFAGKVPLFRDISDDHINKMLNESQHFRLIALITRTNSLHN